MPLRVVARVNDRGLVLQGDDLWLNVSKQAQPAPKLPRLGESVRLFLDGQGYIREITVVASGAATSSPPDDGVDVPAPEEPSRQVEPEQSRSMERLPPDPDLRIWRQAVLNTATAILSSGGRATELDAVLALAVRLEAWVGR
jgi:hypothetical protein